MSTSLPLSPDQHGREAAPGAESGMSSSDLGILKSVSDKRTTQNANPPKRRGPKPDTKPAQTRRQELNRQAQRTHRERKEMYIKALEDEVLRLKEIFSATSQDKEKLIDENTQLKELLARSGIQYTGGSVDGFTVGNQSGGQGSTTSVSGHSFVLGSSQDGGSPQPTTQTIATSLSPSSTSASHHPMQGNQTRSVQQNSSAEKGKVDLEQAGIDFVLTLEKPCMTHLSFVLDKASQGEIGMCGHALMASCPPTPFQALTPETPFQKPSAHDAGGVSAQLQGTWELSRADLSTLLDLSMKLDLDGEITPIMAWGMVLSHPRSVELIPSDFAKLAEELLSKVRCYGFGAVMEEFELRDAMENVLSDRNDVMMVY